MKASITGGARLARFATVGVTAALILLVLAWLLATLGLPGSAAAAIGYLVAFAFAYTAQHRWTFGGTQSHRRALPRYLAAQLACVALSGLVGHVSEIAFAAPPAVMSAAVTLTAGTVSYLLSSLWVFADSGMTEA